MSDRGICLIIARMSADVSAVLIMAGGAAGRYPQTGRG